MSTEGSLKEFYARTEPLSLDELLQARVEHGMDAVDWKEHVRRFHGGSFDPRIDKCEIYDRMMKAESDSETLSHEDADGDGVRDDY